MQIYLYNSDDFDSLGAAIKERRIISAMAVFFEVGRCRQAWTSGTGGAPAWALFISSWRQSGVGVVTH